MRRARVRGRLAAATVGAALAAGTVLLSAPTAHAQPTPPGPVVFVPPNPILPNYLDDLPFYPPGPILPNYLDDLPFYPPGPVLPNYLDDLPFWPPDPVQPPGGGGGDGDGDGSGDGDAGGSGDIVLN